MLDGVLELTGIRIALGEQQVALLGITGLGVIVAQIGQQPVGLIEIIGRQRLLHIGVNLGSRRCTLITVALPVLVGSQQAQAQGNARENPFPVLFPPVAQRFFLIAIG